MDIHYSILVHICPNRAGQQREQKLINLFLEQGWDSSVLCQARKEMKGTPYCLSHLKRKMWWRKRNSTTCFWMDFFLFVCCKADENSKHTKKVQQAHLLQKYMDFCRTEKCTLSSNSKIFSQVALSDTDPSFVGTPSCKSLTCRLISAS